MGALRSCRTLLAALALGCSVSSIAETPADGQVAYDRGDYSTALRIWSALADQGSATAQVRLGLMYARGHGVPRDDAAAVSWYRKAAEQGFAWGQTNLGYMYAQGRGVARDDAEAVSWYRKAAEQDFAMAQDNLGVMYRDGRGVAADSVVAVDWFRKAAAKDYAEGQNNLGWMYAQGSGVVRDYAEAVQWYRKAAERGHARAQANLAYMYEQGRGVAVDDGEAARWYRKAAEQGFVAAQIGLGQMYEAGRGVPKDLAEAAAWYRKAAQQGSARAQTFLSSIENRGRVRIVANCLAQIAEWPVRRVRNRLVVDGVINGRKIGVLLDTGSERTVILRSQAVRLGLSPEPLWGAFGEGVGGTTTIERVTVREMMIGDATRKQWSLPVVVEHQGDDGTAVILGEDFFGLAEVEFDLAHDAVRLYRAKGCGSAPLAYWAAGGATEVEIDTGYYRHPQIQLTVEINGQPVKAKLDSGAGISVLDSSLASRLGITPETPGVRAVGKVGGVGKERVQSWIAPVRSFAIGGETIRDTAIVFADVKTGVMLLGADFLRAHRALVVHSQKRMYFSYAGGPVFEPDLLQGIQDEPIPEGGSTPTTADN